MYLSNSTPILIDERTRIGRTEVVSRLYDMGFNLIPMNGKKPCVEWEGFQSRRASQAEIREWLSGRFPTKDGRRQWRAENHNFAVLTGAISWTEENPGIIVIDCDDNVAEELVQSHCPPTPMMQITGSGNKQFVYRRPSVEDFPYIGNRTKLSIAAHQYNLDIRGDGGLIMAPGSIHPRTGVLYKEETPWTLDLLKQCPVYDPEWLTSAESKVAAPVPARLITADHAGFIGEVALPVEDRESQARRYLESVPGTREGTGADKKCAALTMTLLFGFALPAGLVLEMLNDWGQKADQLDAVGGWYPWSEEELARKIEWSLSQEYRGNVGDRLAPVRDVGRMEAKIQEVVGSFDVGPTIDPKDHLAIAQSFRTQCFLADNQPILIHHKATWHCWTGTRYEVISDDDIRERLWKWLAKCRMWLKGKQVSFKPTRNVVSGVMDALKAVTNMPSSLASPCWLGDGPSEIIAFDNGLLNVDSCLAGDNELMEHTPQWFSPNCLPHRFDASATCPRWLKFLNDVFDEDEERISVLRQWFGYNLTCDNRQQKIAMLIGPPRSGKGTTMAIMSALLGRHNVANTSLASLGGRFGLEPLVGKLSALIDEGHLGKFSDNSLVLERLKAISGGSEQTVDRKGVAALASVSLSVRFTLAVNELPRLSDSSAALRSRLLVIPYFNTYEGREDFSLVDRLLEEVSGITNWALEGLRQLKSNGRFKNPSVSDKIMRDFVYLSSPVKAFVDECCEIGPDKDVEREHLRVAWRRWCEENGHVAGSRNDFGRKLRAVVPRIDDKRCRSGDTRKRQYVGIGLNDENLEYAKLRNSVS